MESIAVASGLWKQAQDGCWACQQQSERMRKRFDAMADAHRAFVRTRTGGDSLAAARDSAALRLEMSEMLLSLRESEKRIQGLTALLAEAVAQSKLFSVLEVCPDGA